MLPEKPYFYQSLNFREMKPLLASLCNLVLPLLLINRYSYLRNILDLRHLHCSMFDRTQCILNDHEFLEGTKNRAIICALVASAL